MTDLFLLPAVLIVILVALHAWFGKGILERGIIFTDLSIAQAAALGSAISLGYFHGDFLYPITLAFALGTGLLIAFATTRRLHLEAFIGLIYVLGASAILIVLAHSAEGMEHFKSLLANDILFTTQKQFLEALPLYGAIGAAIALIYPRSRGFGREALFFSLLALTVTSSVQLAGVLVVFILLVGPILVASMQCRFSPYPLAVFLGSLCGILSMLTAFYADLPTGYTIVFIGAFSALVSVLAFSAKKGSNAL